MDNMEMFLSSQTLVQLKFLLCNGFFKEPENLRQLRTHVNLRYIENFMSMTSDELACCESLMHEIELHAPDVVQIDYNVVMDAMFNKNQKQETQEADDDAFSASPSLLNFTRTKMDKETLLTKKMEKREPVKVERLKMVRGVASSIIISKRDGLSVVENSKIADNQAANAVACLECLNNPQPSTSKRIPNCPHRDNATLQLHRSTNKNPRTSSIFSSSSRNQNGQTIFNERSPAPSTTKMSSKYPRSNNNSNSPIQLGRSREPRISGINNPRNQNEILPNNNHIINARPTADLRHLNIEQESERFVKRFGILSRCLNFTIKSEAIDANDTPLQWLKKVIGELLSHACREFQQSDMVGITMKNENFPERPLGISFRKFSEIKPEVVMDVIAFVLQSNAAFFTSDQLSIQIDRVRPPVGNGRSATDGKAVSFDEFSLSKNSIYVVRNDDNACLGAALIISKEFVDNGCDKKLLKKKFSGVRGQVLLKNSVNNLCRLANVDLRNGGHYGHINDFQQFLTEYTIVVYNSRDGNSVYFEGDRAPNRKCLNLIKEEDHYNVILSLTGVFSTSYYCELCRVRYSRGDRHKNCPYICPCCHASPPCRIDSAVVKCDSCLRYFRGNECLNKHKISKLCGKLKKCARCRVHVWHNKKSKHVCGVKYCNICRTNMPIRHFCYMLPNQLAPDKALENAHAFLFIFYDLETTQDKQLSENTYLHEPNLCVLQKACRLCITSDDVYGECVNCGQRQIIYSESPVDNLLEHIAEMSKRFKVTAIAHNNKGFDGCFVLQKIFGNVSRWRPEVIRTGTKLITIGCGSAIRFIDSLNFIQLPLSRFPSAFKLEGCKGYFPHFFNTSGNKNYIGPIPEKNFYGHNSMLPAEREKFIRWHNQQVQNNVQFRMSEEIQKYCIADVDLLRRGCLKFRECFLSANGVDPFLESLTIASACNLVFRRNFLKQKSIGILPRNGYRRADNQSNVAIDWLSWMAHAGNIFIQHAGNGREVRLPENLLVDGFCETTNTVYEFYGCWFHGCEKCFFNQTCKLSDKDDALFLARENTLEKEERIKAAGYNLISIWQCEYTKILKTNADMREFVQSLDGRKSSPLNPRDAFYGGRTNACKLYHKCDPDEKILYYDVCSLYPYINKYGKYPVGHPVNIYVGNNECRVVNLDTVEGLIKCCILPPRNLYHPVLPYRCNNKLTFPLCRTCAETMQQTECQHAETERQFVGTYVADELRKALELRYKVIEILEIWEYDVVQYNKSAETDGLFSAYINSGLKGKQENSGYPAWCDSEEKKDLYINSYFEREGILLDKGKIGHNSGMRFLYKIMLNSFWGKFGQKENAQQTQIINKPIDLFKLLTNPAATVHNLTIINPEVVLTTWDRVEEDVSPLKTANVVIAAYTTAGARLELYKYLEQLDRRVLYFDTDSIIFSQREGEWCPPTGDYLGDLTDELVEYGEGSYISEFVSGGPKNYSYKFWSVKDQTYKTVCKVKNS